MWREEWSAEIRKELDELRVKRARLDALSAERGRVAEEAARAEGLLRDFEAGFRRYEAAVARARERFEELSRVLARWERVAERRPEFKPGVERYRRSVEEARRRWLSLSSALERWRRLVEARRSALDGLRARLREVEARIADVQRLIDEEEEALRRKRPIQVLTVVDSRTGYDISLLAYPIEGKRLWQIHPDTGQLIKPVEYVEIEWSGSVETEGHEPFSQEENPCEITAQTVIAEEDFPDVETITGLLRRRAIDFFIETFLGNIPESAVKDKFKIQVDKKGAKYEGAVKRWEFKLVEPFWEEVRVLKEGVGYYTYSKDEVVRKEDEIYEKLISKGVVIGRGEVSVMFPMAFVDVEIPLRPAEYIALLDLRAAAPLVAR